MRLAKFRLSLTKPNIPDLFQEPSQELVAAAPGESNKYTNSIAKTTFRYLCESHSIDVFDSLVCADDNCVPQKTDYFGEDAQEEDKHLRKLMLSKPADRTRRYV